MVAEPSDRPQASRTSFGDAEERAQLAGRSMVVKKLTCAADRSGGARLSDRLGLQGLPAARLGVRHRTCRRDCKWRTRCREPIFTPASKAPAGQHDENIDFDAIVELVGREHATAIRRIALEVYRFAAEHARARDIIIADTKFEFGVDKAGNLLLIDEALTPDSSRFWPVASYKPGISPPSFDKQFVRDYLESLALEQKAAGAASAARHSGAHQR